MNVNKYLTRIGYNGALNADLATLRQLCECHVLAVPFDVLDMFGGERKVLNIEKIYNDIVEKKRGGFCYELNGLFHWLLKQLGFQVTLLQGQAYVAAKDVFLKNFDHMTILVTCEGDKWLTDIGWGGNSFIAPLKFEEMTEQTQKSGVYRLRCLNKANGEYVVEAVPKQVLNGKSSKSAPADPNIWKAMYKFDTIPRQFEDFQEMCNYQQDSENSFLKYNAITFQRTPNGVKTTWGFAFSEKKFIDPYTEEITKVITNKNDSELKDLLKKEMGISITFDLQVKARNYHGFTDSQVCCNEDTVVE